MKQEISASYCPYLATGSLIAGRYRIVQTLGVGGMASVYLADDEVLGETKVALKTLKLSGKMTDAAAERFLREVRLTHKINHENVVRTFDFGQDGEIRFYTMEYLRGQTLTTFAREETLSIELILRVASQICRGLAAIHSVGVTHRDLKPDNIMIVDSMRVKITDFGVARGDGSLLTLAAEEILGTIAYLAPEILIGEKATPAVDYYALGAILYELLTGRLPIEDDSPARLIVRKIEESPPDPRSLDKSIPDWIAEAVLDLLEPDPNQRMRLVQGVVQAIVEHAPQNQDTHLVTASCAPISDIPTKVLKRPSVTLSLQPLWGNLYWLKRAGCALVFSLLAIPLSATDAGERMELAHLDNLFQVRGTRPPSNEVVIIAIDEPSYLNLNVPMSDAWPRTLHTKLLNRLTQEGAKRVAFDILFVAPSENAAADAAFSEALQATPTVLGAALGLAQQATANGSFTLEQLTRPIDVFERRSAGIGIVSLPQVFGRIRSFYSERSPVFPDVPSLAEAAADIGADTRTVRPGVRDLINYYGPASSIPRFSYHDVIADEARIPAGTFKGKIVFVGLHLRSRTGPSQREAFETPFDANLYGTEVHATATSNLIQRDWIVRVPPMVEAVACVVIVVSSIAVLLSFQGVLAVGMAASWTGIVLVCQWALFLRNVYVGMATPLIIGLGFGVIVRILFERGKRARGGLWR